MVEGNHSCRPDAVRWEQLAGNGRHTTCWWKGEASYCDVTVDGKASESAGWTYHQPSEAADRIGNYVAFYGHKVTIEG